jgi:hypothetical protein
LTHRPAYSEILDKARADLASANAEKLRLENVIARLQRTVLALSSLVEQPIIDPAQGMTEAIKAALRGMAPDGLFPTTIKTKLEDAGFNLVAQKNPLASIHAILQRLVKKEIVEARPQPPENRLAYFWRAEVEGDNPKEYLKTFSALDMLRTFSPGIQEMIVGQPEEPPPFPFPDIRKKLLSKERKRNRAGLKTTRKSKGKRGTKRRGEGER